MKDSRPNGWTYFGAEKTRPISKLHVIKSLNRVERRVDGGDHRWKSLWLLVCLIVLVGWCGGEVKVRVVSAATPTPNIFTTTTMPLWSMSFFTIDSSLNNHYSQLDMKWVDPTGLLIAQSIGDHKIPVSSPEGSISIKSVTLTESQYIMILGG